MEFQEKLFQALKNDNLQEFANCMETTPCGSLRLGRFPVLSIMYLYNSKRLLHAYEQSFLKHNSWQNISDVAEQSEKVRDALSGTNSNSWQNSSEPVELSAKFRSVAGKCLRFYLNETVSPVEMLLILGKDGKLKKVFSATNMTAPVKQRLKDIYYVKWALSAKFNGNEIILERRPLTHAEKMRWLTLAVCIVLCVAIVVGTPFVVNAFVPFIADGNGMLRVSRVGQIKFSSGKTYVLKNDITVSQDFFVEEVNCELVGNGHTVTVTGGSLFGEFNGKMSDIVFVTDGSPVITNVNGAVENVTVNAVVNKEVNTATGFFATNNYGTITNVTVNVSGSMTAFASEDTGTYACGGVVALNKYVTVDNKTQYAHVQKCTVNYDNFSLTSRLQPDENGDILAEASFGGIVGQNDGFTYECQTTGTITSNTLDVGGICSENNHLLMDNVNNADISQTSDSLTWNPLASGIVLVNYRAVDSCKNYGTISSTTTAAESVGNRAVAVGIVYQSVSRPNWAYVQKCANFGEISATSSQNAAYAAGIIFNNISGLIKADVLDSENSGNVSATGVSNAEAAGIANRNSNTENVTVNLEDCIISGCSNSGNVSAVATNTAMAAGITNQNVSDDYVTAYLQNCKNVGKVTATAMDASACGVANFNTGGIQATNNSGEIRASGKTLAKAAGIAGIAYGYVYRCANTGAIFAESDDEVRVGGISGTAYSQTLECVSVGNIEASGDVCYVGGVIGYGEALERDEKMNSFITVEKCVALCGIKVTTKGNFAAVGGIVGIIENSQKDVEFIQTTKVVQCYFTGSLEAKTNTYVGSIVGVVGKESYLQYDAKAQTGNFLDNLYVEGGAFGAMLVGEDYQTVQDLGTKITSLEEITSDDTYKALLKRFGIKQ